MVKIFKVLSCNYSLCTTICSSLIRTDRVHLSVSLE